MTTPAGLTLDEFLALPGIDERRLELIDGEVYEKVSPRWGHGRIAGELYLLLSEHGFASVEPRAIIKGTGDREASSLLPDVAYYRSQPPADDEWMTRPPDVAVEILSIGQSRAEMRAKVDTYLAFAVPSVWVVDLERECVELFEDGLRRTCSGDDRLEAKHAPGFSLVVKDLFVRPAA